MPSAKSIVLAPIKPRIANAAVKRLHYSGTVVRNSQLHIGVFLHDSLEGVMQFGPPLDKRRLIGLVRDTAWNGFLELNRMAFGDALPRNSESRALSVAMRMIRAHYPHIEWVVSFADATQCGDGTIYRAAGFALTGIRKNNTVWAAPDGERFTDVGLKTDPGTQRRAQRIISRVTVTKGRHAATGAASMKAYRAAGFKPLPGHQLRYIYFTNPAARQRLSVPVLPYAAIEEAGAAMYKGVRRGK